MTIGRFTDDEGRPVDGLPGWVAEHEPLLGWWTADELAGLREVAVEAQALLDTVTRHCLVHSDLNLKNLLLDPASLAVTGLVDWEFAHAGHPYTDLGNLLRFERDPAFTDAVLAAYTARRGGRAGGRPRAGAGGRPLGAGGARSAARREPGRGARRAAAPPGRDTPGRRRPGAGRVSASGAVRAGWTPVRAPA